MPYLVIASSPALHGRSDRSCVFYLVSQAHFISQNCPQNIFNTTIPWTDSRCCCKELLEAKTALITSLTPFPLKVWGLQTKCNNMKVPRVQLNRKGERKKRKPNCASLIFSARNRDIRVPAERGEIKPQSLLASLNRLGTCWRTCAELVRIQTSPISQKKNSSSCDTHSQ